MKRIDQLWRTFKGAVAPDYIDLKGKIWTGHTVVTQCIKPILTFASECLPLKFKFLISINRRTKGDKRRGRGSRKREKAEKDRR